MRIPIRTILLCLAAVFAVSAVGASAALATPKCTAEEQGGDYAVCVRHENKETKKFVQEEFESPNKLEGTSGESILEAKVLGATVKIVCKSDVFSDTPEDSGTSTGSIKFKECKVATPENCKLTEEEIPATFTNKLETPPGSPTKVTFTGNKGTTKEFANITLVNNGTKTCSIANKFPITGDTGSGCTFDTTIETFKLEHQLTCKKEGENLKLGGNPATFSSTASIKANEGTAKEPKFVEWAILES